MRIAVAISFVVHAVGALGISRVGGQPDAMAMAVSIELVEQLPDVPAQMETSASATGTAEEAPSRSLLRRAPAAPRAPRARRPTLETAPPTDENASAADARRGATAQLPVPSGAQSAGASPTLGSPPESSVVRGFHGAAPTGLLAPRADRSLELPRWERISQAVRQHVVYPALARRRGFHGQATVSFLLTPGGMVDQLRVIESSGHDILDAAAMDAVARAVPLPISDQTARVAIPVVFSLQ
jgi:periplasmic protein TonB